MKFIDESTIIVQSGKGGDGCLSFRRERFIPKGGPDGGNGGKGGDIILRSTTRKRTLYHIQSQKRFQAENGVRGQGSMKHGRNGKDLIIEIPPGTIIKNAETDELIFDFCDSDQDTIVAKGGRGGKGNAFFKSSTNRAPRYFQKGESGETFKLKLELKLLADVGIIGLPNAGKSTLIRALTSSNAKIGDYPFTTIHPNLGVFSRDIGEPFILADIPGLIENAHKGEGLGIQFLKHIERTRILIHLIDVKEIDPDNPLSGYNIINKELTSYSADLGLKKQIVVLNKIDAEDADISKRIDAFINAMDSEDTLLISALNQTGLELLIKRTIQEIAFVTQNK